MKPGGTGSVGFSTVGGVRTARTMSAGTSPL